MKNRILSLLLVTIILAGLVVLPVAAAPTTVVVTVNRQTATVGETLIYSINVVPTTNIQTRIRVRVKGVVVYEGDFTSGKVHYYKTRMSGSHVAEAIAYDKTDNKTLSAYSVPTAVKLLPAPSALKVEPYNATALRVSWGAVPGVDGYLVLIAPKSYGPYSLRRITAGTSIIDSYKKTGVQVFYKIVGYNLVDGIRREVTAKTGWKVGVPIGSTSITGISSPLKNRVYLSWAKATGATSYEVHRSTLMAGPYSFVNSTTALTFIDNNLISGRTYYYKIIPRLRLNGVNYYGVPSAVKYQKVK